VEGARGDPRPYSDLRTRNRDLRPRGSYIPKKYTVAIIHSEEWTIICGTASSRSHLTKPLDGGESSSDADLTQASPATVPTKEQIGPYRLLQPVGEGGMGEVWLAEQTRPVHRQVALKIIKAGMDTAQVVARFEAERQALALMDHPAIARVFDAGVTAQGRPYFVMEYVRGESITNYATRQKLSIRQRIDLFIQICEGVQHAHQKGIIHRDLKPSNILVTLQGDRPVPKIIDFGVAKAMTHSLTERTLYTELGALIGTPEYMSPEQAEMSGLDIDTRTDVYALGVVLYELLTGMLPFEAKSLREKGLDEIRRTIREVDPPKPSTKVTTSAESVGRSASGEAGRLASQLRGDLDWITMKALEKDRTRRYATVGDLAADLQRHLDNQPVLASPPSSVYRVQKFVRRNRLAVTAAATLVTLLIAFAGTMVVQTRRVAHERDRVNQEAQRANREATTAKQVSDFLVGLFNVSDPSEARGNTLTAREILARGAQQLERNLKNQPQVQAKLQSTIGNVYTGLGLYEEAEMQLKAALASQRRTVGNDDVDTIATTHALANLYWYQGNYEDAEPLYLIVVERRRRLLGSDHPDTLRTQYDLASLYTMQKRWDKQEPIARATLEAQERVLGGDHPDTIETLNLIQNLYFAQRRYAEAEQVARRVLDGLRRSLGESHVNTIRAMHNLANVLAVAGRVAEAEPLFIETLKQKRRVEGDIHPDVSITENRLATMYMKQGRYGEAELLARAAYERNLKSLGSDADATKQQVNQLEQLYNAWGKPAKAADWRGKLPKGPSPNP
jgi:eukaryotic-like serine/threonine-protein kinase